MKREHRFIKWGEAFGRVLSSSQPDESDLKTAAGFYRADRSSKSLRWRLDLKGISERRKIRKEIDLESEWRRLQYKLNSGQQLADVAKPGRMRRHAAAYGMIASGCAAAILFIMLVVIPRNDTADLQTLEALSEIKTVYSLPTLYLEDGTVVDLNAEGSQSLLADNYIEFSASENEIQYGRTSAHRDVYNTIIIPAGNSFQLVLCDGTHVWLHTKSKLRYFTSLHNGERRVELEGEAFFDVAKDSKRPFVIVSEDHKIEVVGTKFNVSAYPQEKVVYTTLVEGRVNIIVDNPEGRFTMSLNNPGMQSVYNYTIENQHSISSRTVDTEQYTAWMDGMFRFNNASLDDIMFKLSLWYDFKYEIAPHLKSSKFSGEFNRFDDLRTVLDILRKTGTDFAIAVVDDRIVIK